MTFQDFLHNAQNFYWDSGRIAEDIAEKKKILTDFGIMEKTLLDDFQFGNHFSDSDVLAMIFSAIYDFVVKYDFSFMIFHNQSPIADAVYEASLFTALCMFLHHTKRIKGSTLREFTFQYSPSEYTKLYESYDRKIKNDLLDNESTTLRKSRQRRLSGRSVYIDTPEWSAMRPSSEHEWTLYFDLPEEERSVLKRLGNLYNDINKALELNKDDNFKSQLQNAYKKFESKLKKLEYKKIIILYKTCFEHIDKDKKYYGMNLYRLEKELSPYKINKEVELLSKCQTDSERDYILQQTLTLENIFYPKLYNAFFRDIIGSKFCADTFIRFRNEIVFLSLLTLDDLIEKNIFSAEWEMFFLDTINSMTPKVFYDWKQIDFDIFCDADEEFRTILSTPAMVRIFQNLK